MFRILRNECLYRAPADGSTGKRRLHIELLEDRRLLKTYYVDTNSDSSYLPDKTTLRYAIEQSNLSVGVYDEINFSLMPATDRAAGIKLSNGPLEINNPVKILGNGVSIIRDGSVFQAFVVNLTSGGTGEPSQTLIQNLDVRGFIQAVHIQNVHAGGVVTINDNTIHDNKALQPDAPAPTYERAAIEVAPVTAPSPELADFGVRR